MAAVQRGPVADEHGTAHFQAVHLGGHLAAGGGQQLLDGAARNSQVIAGYTVPTISFGSLTIIFLR